MSNRVLLVPPSLAKIKIIAPTTPLTSVTKLMAGPPPEPIDWRDKVNLQPPKNQELCGNCWAMSSTAALTDKFLLPPPVGKGIKNLNLDPMVLTQCCTNGETIDQGCCGNNPALAATYMEQHGLPIVSSGFPDITDPMYQKLSCGGKNPTCQNILKLGQDSKVDVYKAIPDTTVSAVVMNGDMVDGEATILNMKQHLQEHGPFVCSFNVTAEFEIAGQVWESGKYWPLTNGVYVSGVPGHMKMYDDWVPGSRFGSKQELFKQLSGESPVNSYTSIVGQHAVECVGWGDDGKMEYWIVKNSWGTDWCDNGYFKIAMNSKKNGNPNSEIAFDVPVRMGGDLFGGATLFNIDKSSGAPENYSYSGGGGDQPHGNYSGNMSKRTKKILLIILVVLIVLVVAWVLYSKLAKRE